MDNKFKKIASFLETLSSETVLNENEEALLLVGGNGENRKTNGGCTNNGCVNPNPDRIDNTCTNNGCTNNGC